MKLHYVIDGAWNGLPLERFLKQKVGLSRKLLGKLKAENRIYCNGVLHKVFLPIYSGNVIEIDMNFIEKTPHLHAEAMSLDRIYEDEWMIALNKPAGIVVHPTHNYHAGTLANGLAHYYQEQGKSFTIRPVSRLDRDTTGIILFAKNPMIQDALIKQMKTQVFKKEYIGMVHAAPKENFGSIRLPIARKAGSIIEREISLEGAPAVTHYRVLKKFPTATFLHFVLETGRTHQIRVHCQGAGFPLMGDSLYAQIEDTYIKRQALHALKISFLHPVTEKKLALVAPVPNDFKTLLSLLNNDISSL